MRTASAEDPVSLPDADIVRRVAADDWEALSVLMRRHNPMLYRAARSILKDEAEAEDAVQEAYLRAYRAMGSFRGDAKLSTWLVRIVVNEAIARLRKHRRAAEIIEMGDDGEHDAGEASSSEPERPERAAMRAEARDLLERSIDALPTAFRTVFVLRAVEEMSVEETSAALDIPEATVRTRFFRAKALLRETLARNIDFPVEDAFSFAGARCDRIVAGVLARLKPWPRWQCLMARDAP